MGIVMLDASRVGDATVLVRRTSPDTRYGAIQKDAGDPETATHATGRALRHLAVGYWEH